MAAAALPFWAYEPRTNDPIEVKSVNSEMLNELIQKVTSEDSSLVFPCVEALWFNNGSLTKSAGGKLTVDFHNGRVDLPPVAVSSCQTLPVFGADSIRHAAFLNVSDCEVASSGCQVVTISAWDNTDKTIYNVYLSLSLSESLMLANAVARLVAQDSRERTKVLRPLLCGKVKVATCDANRHSENGDCCDPERVMPFTADCESLGFYENQLSNCPLFDFRFYKEQGPRSIDLIMINKAHGHIQMKQASNIYIINKCADDSESFDRLVQMFRENVIKSQPEIYYAYPERHVPVPPAAQPLPSSRSVGRESDDYGSQEAVWQNTRDLIPDWLVDLQTGKHLPKDEGLLAEWCACEYDLNECIKSENIPFTDPQSGGLDPNSLEHLQRSVEDIKDHLLQLNYPITLSRLHACLSVFGATLLQPVEGLEDVEFLKRIYFLSGRN